MPDTVEGEETVTMSQQELGEILGRAPANVSQATYKKHFCAGYPVFEWAEMHPAGNQVRRYHVPKRIVKDKLDPGEWIEYGILDNINDL